MTLDELNILGQLAGLGVRFFLTGGYVLRQQRPYHDVDVVCHPDDEAIVIGTGLGGSRIANGRHRYIIHRDTVHIDMFFNPTVDLNDAGCFDSDEYGFKVLTPVQLFKYCNDFPHITNVELRRRLEQMINYTEGATTMISVSKLLAKPQPVADGQPQPPMSQYANIRFEVCDNGILLSVEQQGAVAQRIIFEGAAEEVQAKIVAALPNVVVA